MSYEKINSNLSNAEIFENFLILTGSTWISETIYLYTVTPLSIVGIILNTLNLIIFFKMVNNNSSSSLIGYMKVYSLNSIILSIMIFLFIFTHLPRYFQFSISYLARLYRCLIIINVSNMLNFYESLLYILIMMERISGFVLKYKKYTNIPCYKTSFFCLFICILICLPTYFMFNIKSESEFYNDIIQIVSNKNVSISYCEKTQFIDSIYGKILISIVIIIMNGVTLIIEITITIIAIVNFKRYLKKRCNFLNKKKSIVMKTNQSSVSTSANTNNQIIIDNLKVKMNRSSQNLTKMSIQFLILSIISNILVLFFNFLVLFKNDDNIYFYFLTQAASFFTLIKLSANFFFFYAYNYNFKNSFLKIFS
jgi:hypothetical protein